MSANPTLLLVEDDRDDLDFALRILGSAGFPLEVEVARDGQEASELLGLEDIEGGADNATSSLLPDVVFLDLKLPRIDGWELLRRLRRARHTAGLPVVVLSASDRPEDIRRCYELGANSYLMKRYDARSRSEQLVETAHYWLALNRTPASRQRSLPWQASPR